MPCLSMSWVWLPSSSTLPLLSTMILLTILMLESLLVTMMVVLPVLTLSRDSCSQDRR